MAEGHREAAPRVLDGRKHGGSLAAEGRRPSHIAVYPRKLTAANTWSDWTVGALGTIIMFFSSWTVLAAPIFGATGTIIMFFSSYNMPQSPFASGSEAGNWQRVPASFEKKPLSMQRWQRVGLVLLCIAFLLQVVVAL